MNYELDTWYVNLGFEIPKEAAEAFNDGLSLLVEFRDGTQTLVETPGLRWQHIRSDGDVMHFKIIEETQAEAEFNAKEKPADKSNPITRTDDTIAAFIAKHGRLPYSVEIPPEDIAELWRVGLVDTLQDERIGFNAKLVYREVIIAPLLP